LIASAGMLENRTGQNLRLRKRLTISALTMMAMLAALGVIRRIQMSAGSTARSNTTVTSKLYILNMSLIFQKFLIKKSNQEFFISIFIIEGD